MAQFAEDLCCDITTALLGEEGCAKLSGGIEDVRLGCLKYFSWTENDCTTPSTAYITGVTAVDPSDGVTTVTPLYRINIKKKTGEHIFRYTFDEDTNTTKREGSITFDVIARDDTARCAFEQYIGQEVVVFFKYRGSDEWFVEGREGGLRVRLIEGGSGTDTSRATSFEISGDDMPVAHKRVFETDAAGDRSFGGRFDQLSRAEGPLNLNTWVGDFYPTHVFFFPLTTNQDFTHGRPSPKTQKKAQEDDHRTKGGKAFVDRKI